MFEITDGNTANRLVTSSYVPCARNITSGNLSVNKAHYLIKISDGYLDDNIDDSFVLDGNTESTKAYQSEYKFGECVSVGADGTIYGEDYLGNKIVEKLTGDEPSKHAFFKIFKFVADSAASGVDIPLTPTGIFGLEFQTAKVDNVIVNGVDTAASETSGDDTTTYWEFTAFDNQQADNTAGDTRGTIAITEDASSGTGDEIEVIYTVTEYCVKDEDGNDEKGGLFGVLPYAG